MEALATGLPVICHDIGGMSFAIDESCGFKIPCATARPAFWNSPMPSLDLWTTQSLLNRLFRGRLRRAKALSWDEKVRKIANAYDAIPPGDTIA